MIRVIAGTIIVLPIYIAILNVLLQLAEYLKRKK